MEETRARGTAGVAVGGPGIVALPNATHELGVPAEPVCVWNVSISVILSAMMIEDALSRDLPRERPHPLWPSLTSLRLTTNEFNQQSEKDFSFCYEFGGGLFK